MERRKRMGVLGLVLAACVFTALSVGSQEDITTVNDSAFDRRMRPPVPFVHDEHNEIAGIEDCAVCHHVYEDGKRVEGESSEGSECSECHAPNPGGFPMDLVKAYHLRCKGCHQERKAGPVMCAECHPKN